MEQLDSCERRGRRRRASPCGRPSTPSSLHSTIYQLGSSVITFLHLRPHSSPRYSTGQLVKSNALSTSVIWHNIFFMHWRFNTKPYFVLFTRLSPISIEILCFGTQFLKQNLSISNTKYSFQKHADFYVFTATFCAPLPTCNGEHWTIYMNFQKLCRANIVSGFKYIKIIDKRPQWL